MPWTRETELARSIATRAGEMLLDLRRRGLSGEALRDAGDRRSHELIVPELRRAFPSDGILSEEGADDPARLAAARVWIVDPLDGTREFAEPPRDDWAVHVALAVGGEVAVGAVALPGRGLTLTSGGADVPPPAAVRPSRPRIVVSRTRPTEHAVHLAERLDGDLVPMGSAGAKAMAVVLGEAEIYAHSGGQFEWDSAAPVAVAAAAGLHVSRLDGSPLAYNRPDPWLPDLLICTPDLAPHVIGLCRAVGA